jgi:hypothetical protein
MGEISVSELKSAFGTYIGTNQKDILTLLTQPTESQKHMTTIASADLEYRASKAVVDDLVQGFQKGWTPKGTAIFTPIAIPQRRHKFDWEMYPDDIVDSWLGFMAAENQTRATWPISRYILEKLIMPKINDNRELKLIAKGVYAAPVTGTAQATGLSMDGFITILEKLKIAGGSNINFITLATLTKDNIFDQVELFGEGVAELYQDIPMEVFISRKWFAAYHKKRRDLHGQDLNYAGQKDVIEGTNMTLTPLPSMNGKEVIFCTPKENFIRLMNRNDGASNITIESVDRQVKIFADWYESVGFGIQEAVFASVPVSQASH